MIQRLIQILLHRRGPALWPEVFPLKLLQARLRELGSALFSAVYQGEPAPAAGLVFRPEWFPRYTALPRLLEVGQAWDTALKGGQEHDYSCGITGGRGEDGRLYLLDVWRGQVETPQLVRQVAALAERWRPRWILVEDAGGGPALLSLLRAGRVLPLIPVKPDRDKRRRALAVTPLVEGGQVQLPQQAPWLEEFCAELQAFPGGAHDDQVDAFVYLLSRFAAHGGAPMVGWADIRRPRGW